MLLPSFFVIDIDKYDDLPDLDLPENAYIAYKIGSHSVQLVHSFYRKLFLSRREYPFCLLLDIEGIVDKLEERPNNILNLLVSFTFNISYLKRQNDNPLVIFGTKKPTDNHDAAIVAAAFKKHGYEHVETGLINACNIPMQTNESDNGHFSLNANNSTLAVDYVNAIKQVTSPDSSFFFFLDNPDKLNKVLALIEETEMQIKSEMGQTFELLKQNISLKARERKLLTKIETLREKLNSFDNYHSNYNTSLNRYKRQIKELLGFYKNEYEILPLWYKRLGHIIKVLTGKRTFKSLFSDRVKKYKD